jgi:branched-chain amino acid transport system permease protein
MDFFWHILFIVANWVPTILAHNLIFGKGKILNFGPMAVMMITNYSIFITLLMTGSYAYGILAGLIAATIISITFALLSLRLEADGFGVLSIAMHLIVIAIVLNWTSLTRGALGIPQLPKMPFLNSPMDFALFASVIAFFWILFMWWIHRSSLSRQLEALADNPWHAKSLGINRSKVHIIVFLIYGLATVLVGMMFPQYFGLLHPNDMLFPVTIFYVLVIVAGGPGKMWGVLLSVTVVVLLKEGIRFVPLPIGMIGPVRLILFGVILFAAVWWRRDTLFPKQRTI